MLKFYITCVNHVLFCGYFVKDLFPPTLLLLLLLIYTYFGHLRFNYIFLFASNFNTYIHLFFSFSKPKIARKSKLLFQR